MVGRSSSSDGVVPDWVPEAVAVEESLLEVVVPELSRRFMVGRSGSSVGGLLEVVVVDVDVVLDVVEPELSRRFMAGRSESSPLDVVAVVDVVG
jgi:hypothetical protein